MVWFTFTDASKEIFVINLRDRAMIAHARELIAGETEADPHIAGTVVKSPVSPNIGWSFHLDPESLFFFELSAEVGDSTMRYIEEHLPDVGGALLPGSVWTGWSSALLDELSARYGGAGADIIAGSRKPDILFGRAGDDTLRGGAGGDHMIAGAGNDRAGGGAGGDKISGGAGRDRLAGGTGADLLDGGDGNDQLAGGEGRDTFLFAPGSGRDNVVDFADGDKIDLRPYAFSRKSDIGLQACGDDLRLVLGGGNTITVVDYLLDHAGRDIFGSILI